LIYPGFATTGASFVLPDFLTRVQGLRALQIGDALNWIALPQFVLVPLVALLLKRIIAGVWGHDARDRQLDPDGTDSRLGRRGFHRLAAG